jgi:hypothetical protein
MAAAALADGWGSIAAASRIAMTARTASGAG